MDDERFKFSAVALSELAMRITTLEVAVSYFMAKADPDLTEGIAELLAAEGNSNAARSFADRLLELSAAVKSRRV
jgi:hypothetical protein